MFNFFLFILFFCFSINAEFVEIKELHPLETIQPNRVDVIAKYIYAKHREWGVKNLFGLNIYRRNLEVWNNFYEEEPFKQSFNDFHQAFDQLLDSVKHNGFNLSFPVLLGSNGIIMNGAHRSAACLLYNKPIFVATSDKSTNGCGFDFLQKKKLDSKYLDAIALQYCELKSDSYILVVFPAANGNEKQVEEIISDSAEIVYKKNISFTPNGGLNFILTAYENEPFIQGWVNNNLRTASSKAKKCFPENLLQTNQTKVYLVKAENLETIRKCKERIRDVFQISHDSVHSTDTHQEAIILARALFNDNSIYCLNHRKNTPTRKFNGYLKKYREWLITNEKESEWFCIDGGGVLAAFGLRDCTDLDFLSYGNNVVDMNILGIENHNDQLAYYTQSLDDILFDPDNYFFYKGVKFCSLSIIKKMKERRREKKDLSDILLIDGLYTGSALK